MLANRSCGGNVKWKRAMDDLNCDGEQDRFLAKALTNQLIDSYFSDRLRMWQCYDSQHNP